MKAYYYLAQAQLALHHPNEATNSALTAYDLCISTSSPSTRNVSELVLKAKKEKWEVRERERLRTRNAMLRELEERLDVSKAEDLSEIDEGVKAGDISLGEAEEERIATEDVARRKIEELRSLFALADPQYSQRRVSHRRTGRSSKKQANIRYRRCRIISSTTYRFRSCTTPSSLKQDIHTTGPPYWNISNDRRQIR